MSIYFIYEGWTSQEKSEISLDVPDGVYYYQLTVKNEFISSGKIIVQ